jgi:hypothetical protein
VGHRLPVARLGGRIEPAPRLRQVFRAASRQLHEVSELDHRCDMPGFGGLLVGGARLFVSAQRPLVGAAKLIGQATQIGPFSDGCLAGDDGVIVAA